MSEHIKEGNKIQLSLNHPGKPEGNAAEVAAFVGAKSFGLDGDLNYMHIYEPTQLYRVTNLETYASTLHKNIIQDGQWVELWKEQTAEELEQRIQEQEIEAPRVTYDHIQAMLKRVQYVTVQQPGDTTSTFVHAYLDGKFFLASGFSGCVDPARFNPLIGIDIATKNAMHQAEQKLWELEGYALYKSLLELDNYKQANIDKLLSTRIPILDQIYDLCLAIENCGASPELTEAVTKAGALRKPITELVEQAIALGIGQGIVSVSHSNDNSKNI